MHNTLVSAVIPTRNRPELVARAVASCLAQTHAQMEVVVVIDGADSLTVDALQLVHDPRLRWIELSESVGGSEARNVGVQQARGEWVAFLDDDDAWHPTKIEKQLDAAGSRNGINFLVCSQVIARTPQGDLVWPEKPPQTPYSEYLLVRNRLTYGEGLIQTSTLLARRELLQRIPFRRGLRKHQDWDWILRCTDLEGFEVVFVREPLAVWSVDPQRARVSQQNAWQISYQWIRDSRRLVSRRAYASFLAMYVSRQAADERAWGAFWPLFRDMMSTGSPRLRDLFVFLAAWLIPTRVRGLLRDFLRGKRGGPIRPADAVRVPAL